MPDKMNTSKREVAQRGLRGGFPVGRPRFPARRYPMPLPIRQRFPRFFFFPVDFGFPAGRCYYIDEFGRCCDRFGRCYNRYGVFPAAQSAMNGWYGIPGGWDMMPDYDDMIDYDMDDMDDMDDD